ncbi:MAG: 4-hydroxy-tetrahydrodipicolinate reductase [Ruminococcaceae bacterium]|nr:4-hydroxy-tetrahydrodipicolinate reductase [Oscillospiraceae bacterium]
MKILINGIGGRMGAEVKKMVLDGYRSSTLCAGVDINEVNIGEAPVYTSWADVKETPDCIIDFSHHTATEALLKYAVEHNIPTVVATTGHDERESALIVDAAKKIPVFHSANMSLGIALLCELAKTTAKTFPDANIEIIEKHHNRKLDAPSGTALLLAREIQKIREKAFFTFGRQGQAKRMEDEIGIHAIRMGNIVGEHEVIVGTDTQTITLKHEAHSRSLFAEGAIAAADFIKDKPAGLYDMYSMIN